MTKLVSTWNNALQTVFGGNIEKIWQNTVNSNFQVHLIAYWYSLGIRNLNSFSAVQCLNPCFMQQFWLGEICLIQGNNRFKLIGSTNHKHISYINNRILNNSLLALHKDRFGRDFHIRISGIMANKFCSSSLS